MLGVIILVVILDITIIALLFTAFWKICEKAGREGWEGIVPIYNYMVFAEIGKNPKWWGLMMLVPIANIIFLIKICNGLSKAFGKSDGFTVGLVLLGIVFFPMLGFGDAKYVYGTNQGSNEELLDN